MRVRGRACEGRLSNYTVYCSRRCATGTGTGKSIIIKRRFIRQTLAVVRVVHAARRGSTTVYSNALIVGIFPNHRCARRVMSTTYYDAP